MLRRKAIGEKGLGWSREVNTAFPPTHNEPTQAQLITVVCYTENMFIEYIPAVVVQVYAIALC